MRPWLCLVVRGGWWCGCALGGDWQCGVLFRCMCVQQRDLELFTDSPSHDDVGCAIRRGGAFVRGVGCCAGPKGRSRPFGNHDQGFVAPGPQSGRQPRGMRPWLCLVVRGGWWRTCAAAQVQRAGRGPLETPTRGDKPLDPKVEGSLVGCARGYALSYVAGGGVGTRSVAIGGVVCLFSVVVHQVTCSPCHLVFCL